MVNRFDVASDLDAVSRRLAGHDQQGDSVLRWAECRQRCAVMRRRATWCTVSAWLFLSTAAIVSSVVAITMSSKVSEIFIDQVMDQSDSSVAVSSVAVAYTPRILVAIAALLGIGGLAALLSGWMPGLRSTRLAIDLSLVCEAVNGLLMVGIPYPDAFRTASQIAPSGEAKQWLIGAATRVESGQSPHTPLLLAASPPGSRPTSSADSTISLGGDIAMLELLIASSDDHPAEQWSIASHHFREIATRRLSLLTQSLPLITTLLAGMLLWVSISLTLGWIWKSVGYIVNNDFGY